MCCTGVINNDTRATIERVQVQQCWGWIYADTVYYLHLYTRRLALSAFWRKGPARRWDRFPCPPQLGAQGTCPRCPLPLNPHVRLLRSCCSASRLQYRTDKSTSSHRCSTMASTHDRDGRPDDSSQSSPCRQLFRQRFVHSVEPLRRAQVLCLGDSIILPFRAHR